MKVPIEPGSISLEEIKGKLETQFPNYEYKYRSKKQLIVKKTGSIGAVIMVRKKHILVNGAFPTMGGQLIFTITLLLIGVLIPIIIYLATFQPKMKGLEKELSNYLQSTVTNSGELV